MNKPAKEYYRNYQADDTWSELSGNMLFEILAVQPNHVLEFGSGSGKHLQHLDQAGIVACGLDISITNLLNSHFKNENKFLLLGDETNLRHLCNFDVVFTVSVLDHIEDISGIVEEFKRISNKTVLLAEASLHAPEKYYWDHDYTLLGFRQLGYHWKGEDGAFYHIWKWTKNED